jgi:hemoglobin-like flavoprotein
MHLTEDELDLLRNGLRIMLSRKELAAEVFYANLFDIAPQTRPLFSDDIVGQTEKVMFAFGAVVGQIHDLEACRAMTHDLAVRHVAYGVVAEHYALVGRSVMRTLEMVLDDDFTPEMDAAWRRAYDAIAAAMIASAYPTSGAANLQGAPVDTPVARTAG